MYANIHQIHRILCIMVFKNALNQIDRFYFKFNCNFLVVASSLLIYTLASS